MSKEKKKLTTKKKIQSPPTVTGIFKYPYITIIAVLLVTYFQVIKFDFVYLDDDLIILDNYDKISSPASVVTAFTSQYGFNQGTPYYRPIVMLSFVLDAQISGRSPIFYHISNLIFHFLVAILLLKILVRFNIPQKLALLITLIFVVHPLVTNAVIWIVGRNDLIAAIFTLLSFIYFMKYLEQQNIKSLFLHSGFYLLALLSKEVAIMLPLLSLIYVLLFVGNGVKGKALVKIIGAWIIPVILFLVLRYSFTVPVKNVTYGVDALVQNIQSIPDVISKIFIPVKLSVLPTFSSLRITIGTLIFLILIILPFIIKQIDKRRYYLGLAWFFIFIIPGLLVLYSNQSERFEYLDTRAYLPVIGILISLGEFLKAVGFFLESSSGFVKSFAGILILAVLTFFQSKKYQNAITFAESALESNPDKAFFYQKLGDYYFTKGDYVKASEYLEQTVERAPNNYLHFKNLSLAYYYLGNELKALSALQKAYKLRPNDFEVLSALIKINYNLKRYKDSFFFANKVIELGGSVDANLYNDLKLLQSN